MDKRDMISGAVWLGLAAFVFGSSLHLGIGALHKPGPGFLPFCGSIGLALLACALILSGALKKGQPPLSHLWKDGSGGRVAIVAAALVAYGFLLPKLGYILTTLGLMVLLLGLGKLKPWVALLVSLLAVFSSYGLFHYGLKAPLPKGLLFF